MPTQRAVGRTEQVVGNGVLGLDSNRLLQEVGGLLILTRSQPYIPETDISFISLGSRPEQTLESVGRFFHPTTLHQQVAQPVQGWTEVRKPQRRSTPFTESASDVRRHVPGCSRVVDALGLVRIQRRGCLEALMSLGPELVRLIYQSQFGMGIWIARIRLYDRDLALEELHKLRLKPDEGTGHHRLGRRGVLPRLHPDQGDKRHDTRH